VNAEGSAWHPVGASEDFDAGKVRPVEIAGRRLAVGRSDNGFFAVDDSCPHAGASLGEGMVDGDFLICPLHAYAYDVRTGDCEEDLTVLAVFRVREMDGRLEVWLPA
jgi:nitrite reductase/ring-hydroxylating ferredoxin subunit